MNGNLDGDVVRSGDNEPPSLPRKVKLVRGSEGYGFNLHGEKGIHGQYISAIDEGSPAQLNGVRVGDRVIAVNEEDVEDLPHSKVVERIRAGGSEVTLLLVDDKCDEFYKARGVKIPQDKFEVIGAKDEGVSAEGEEAAKVQEDEQQQQQQQQEQLQHDETPKVVEDVVAPVQQNGAVVVENAVEEDRSQPEATEGVQTQQQNDDDQYEEVVPMAAATKEVTEPVDVPQPEHVEPAPPTISSTKTTTTTISTSNNDPAPAHSPELDMAAARPKPKRNEVKKATHNWKQKYDDFNKL